MGPIRQVFAAASAVSAFALSQPAAAQQSPVQDIAARVRAVEAQVAELQKENAELRGVVARLTAAQQNGAAVQLSPIAPAETEARPPTPPALATAAAPTRASRWDRAYVGLGVGLSKTHNVSNTFDGQQFLFFTFDRTGKSIGGEIGRRWQKGRLVAGLELQGVYTTSGNILFPPDRHVLYRSGGALVRVSGQLGWDFGPVLVYATAGPQFTQVRRPLFCARPCSTTDYQTALNYGVGLAAPISNDLSLDLQFTTAHFNPNPATVESRTRVIDELLSLELGF